MRKKFFSLLLAVCLILSCTFAFSACGDKGGKDENNNLAGKTIRCSEFYNEFDFGGELYFEYREYNEGVLFKIYGATMTYNELLEFCLGTNAISYPNNAQPATIEEARELFVQKLEEQFFNMAYNPHVQFSEDLTKAYLLYGM